MACARRDLLVANFMNACFEENCQRRCGEKPSAAGVGTCHRHLGVTSVAAALCAASHLSGYSPLCIISIDDVHQGKALLLNGYMADQHRSRFECTASISLMQNED